MKTVGKLALALGGLTLLLLVAVALSGGWALWHGGPADGAALLHIDGETIELASPGAGGLLVAMAGLMLGLSAVTVVAVVVPAALLFALAMASLVIVVAFGSLLGGVALLLSPLLLPLALAVWLWRRGRRVVPTRPGAAQ